MRPNAITYHSTVNAAFLFGAMIVVNLGCSLQAFQGLKGEIQKELDSNPFLKEEGVKLRVDGEENGYVTLEMYEGNRQFREDIAKDVDILADAIEMRFYLEKSSKHMRRTVAVLRRTIEQISEMEGVKQVILTALVNTPIDHAWDAYKEKDYTEAFGWYQEAAKEGIADAQFTLGYMYYFGQGVQQDYQKALQHYRKAADQGYDRAQYELGRMYQHGRGVRQDYQKAARFYREAAAQENIPACNALAWLLATCPDESVRNGKEAVANALNAVSADSKNWNYVDTLAAAYARDGQFSEAVETQERAMSLLRTGTQWSDESVNAQERLELYKSQRPFTVSPTPDDSQ